MAEKKYDIFKPFQRAGDFPLDRSSIFTSYEDAEKYAHGLGDDEKKLGKTSYLGQIISVVDPSLMETAPESAVTVYKIVYDPVFGKTLSEIGQGGGGGGTVVNIRSTDNDIKVTSAGSTVYLTENGISNPQFEISVN